MKHLCEYGCGQTATYFKLATPKVPNGRYSCLPSPNSCPAKRNKTTGDLNPSKREDVRKTLSDTNSKLFAKGSPLRKKCEATLIKKYGVKNPMSIKEVSDTFVANRRAKNNYKYNSALNSESANKKRSNTRIKKGYDLDPALKEPFERYEQAVDTLTNQSYKKYKDLINPNNLTRGRVKGTYQLDHIISKIEGFRLAINPAILSHPANLRMLTIEANISKSSKSHYTKEQLLEAIKQLNIKL